MSGFEQLHATAIALAIDSDGPLVGVLIVGDSGAGKSSLGMLSIDSCPFRRTALVADDIVRLKIDDIGACALPPQRIAGLIEVRGFGPAAVRSASACRVLFAVDLSAQSERVPKPGKLQLPSGTAVVPMYPFKWAGDEATAAARLRLMTASILMDKK